MLRLSKHCLSFEASQAVNAAPQSLSLPQPLPLDGGGSLVDARIAYETYGDLAQDRSNAILLCHALTGDQYVAREHPVTGKPGWWERMVGPGKPIDTRRFHVICANVTRWRSRRCTPSSAGRWAGCRP